MEIINKICRLCLSSQDKDNEIVLNNISNEQKEKFEEITGEEVKKIKRRNIKYFVLCNCFKRGYVS